MPMQNPWSFEDPVTSTLKRLGLQALKSGAISPDQAAANAPGAAQQGQGQTLPIGMNPAPAGPLDMNGGAAALYDSVSGIGNRKGAKARAELGQNDTTKTGTTRFLTKPADQLRAERLMAQGSYPDTSYPTGPDGNPDKTNPIYNFDRVTTDPNDPIQQQKAGVGRMEDLLKMEAQANLGRPTMDWRPLGALADSRAAEMGRKSNILEGMSAPTDPTQKFMAYADEIQKRKGDIQKSIAENMKTMKGGTASDQLSQALTAKILAEQANPAYDRMQALQDRMDNMAHQNTLKAIRGDKNLRDKLVQSQNLGNALMNLSKADHITPQQFDEAQQAIRANLGIKAGSGVGERERTQINDMGLSVDRIKQILSSTPADVNQPEFLAHIQNLASIEQENIRNQFHSRLAAISGGNPDMYRRHPEYQEGINEILGAQMAQIPTPGSIPKAKVHAKPSPAAAAAAGSKTEAPAAPALPFGLSDSDIDAEIARRKGGK
jgi:hypothetical protein